MVENNDEKTKPQTPKSGEGDGTQTPTENPAAGTQTPAPSPVEDFKAENDRRSKILEDETALMERKEKHLANEMAMGKGQMLSGGTGEAPKTEEQLASDARVKAIGEAAGSDWSKKM